MRWKKPAEWGRRFLAAVSVRLWLLSTALYYIGCRSYIAQTKTAENCRRILMKNVYKVNAETTKNTTTFFLRWPGNRPSSSTIRDVRFSARGKIGDVGERFAGDLAQITIGARRLTDLSQLTFLKASYLTEGEETIVPKSQWWKPPRALFLRELKKKNFLFSHRHL